MPVISSRAPEVSPKLKTAAVAVPKFSRGSLSPPRSPAVTPRSPEHHDHNTVHSCNCPEFVVHTAHETPPGHTDIPLHYVKPKAPFFVTEYEREFTWPRPSVLRSMPDKVRGELSKEKEDADHFAMKDEATQTADMPAPNIASQQEPLPPPIPTLAQLQRLRDVLMCLYNRGFDRTMNSAAIDEIDTAIRSPSPHLTNDMTTVMKRLKKRLQANWVVDEGPDVVSLCREAVDLLQCLLNTK